MMFDFSGHMWSCAVWKSFNQLSSWWLLCKQYAYTLIRVSRHYYVIRMFLLCLCIFVSNKAFWSWSWKTGSVRLSVRPSVCLSVCHTFFTVFPLSYHHEIFRSYYHGQKWCPCKRSRSEVKGQGHRGQHPTYPFPDSNSSLNSHMAMKSCTQLEAA